MAKDSRKLLTKPSDRTDKQKSEQERFDDMSDRNEELCHDKEIEDACLELYADIEKGFSDQMERANAQMDWWDMFNCELGPKQFYSGNSKVFLPFVHDAIKARKVRFTNQIFPPSGKNVEVITSENKPEALMSLLEFYIRKTRLRSAVIPSLLVNGDVEGQYNIYMGWTTNEHHVTWRVEKKPTLEDDPDIEIDEEDEAYWDIEEETVVHSYPDVEILPDADVLVLPQTARNAGEALSMGGSATVIRRWTKARVQQLIRDKEIDKERAEQLLAIFANRTASETPNKDEHIVDSAGIKKESGKMFCLVYETWAMINIKGERRICRIRFGTDRLVLSCKRNPFWCDQVPLISAPANRVDGSFKGRSDMKLVETIQIAANDFINEGLDSATYAMMPIVMTDPAKNPRTGSMQLSVAAIWETSPQDTKFAVFPPLYQHALEVVGSFRQQIFQTLSVNPAMIPTSQSKGGKTNQAQVAQEQQVDILTTADVVTGLEGDVLTPVLRWFVYLDHQYRDKDLTLRQFGPVGNTMNMEIIKPVQMDRRWEVRWFGVEAARSAQQMQLQMAGLNMVKGIPKELYPGFELNMAPVLQTFLENLFGPRVAALVFQDMKKKLGLQAQFENELLEEGFPVPVNVVDNDQEHMQSHQAAMQQSGDDPSGVFRAHIMDHMQQMQKKNAMQALQAKQGLPPPGGQPPQNGGPRQGANSQGPRGGQNPPGVIHQDRLRDPGAMPRARPGGV